MKKDIIIKIGRWGMYLVIGIGVVVAVTSREVWWPKAVKLAEQVVSSRKVTPSILDSHEGDGHAAPATDAGTLELSSQAKLNLGLTKQYLKPLELKTYFRTLSVPGMIIERPGRSRIDVSAPLTGIILEIYHSEGETVSPGDPLFKIRLTHQDLVQMQTEFLKSLGELQVEQREITRLEIATRSGAIAGKQLLVRQYSRDILMALINSQRESLRLHGLSAEQILEVEESGHLLQELIVVADSPIWHQHDGSHHAVHQAELVIQNLQIDKGRTVLVGETLCELVDYSQLYIEGKAFEGDAFAIASMMKTDWSITALMETSEGLQEVPNLKLAFLSNVIGKQTRTLPFFIDLPNELLQDQIREDKRRYVTWRFRPGQRLQLQIPIQEWPNEFVLPVDALAKEGAEYFIFQENGGHFDRVPVHVKFRDQVSVVIANDGSLFPGDIIAMRSAHQMQIAMKNKAGGAVDPHAGHNH